MSIDLTDNSHPGEEAGRRAFQQGKQQETGQVSEDENGSV